MKVPGICGPRKGILHIEDLNAGLAHLKANVNLPWHRQMAYAENAADVYGGWAEVDQNQLKNKSPGKGIPEPGDCVQ